MNQNNNSYLYSDIGFEIFFRQIKLSIATMSSSKIPQWNNNVRHDIETETWWL